MLGELNSHMQKYKTIILYHKQKLTQNILKLECKT